MLCSQCKNDNVSSMSLMFALWSINISSLDDLFETFSPAEQVQLTSLKLLSGRITFAIMQSENAASVTTRYAQEPRNSHRRLSALTPGGVQTNNIAGET